MDPSLDRSKGNFHNFGNFEVRHFLLMKKKECLAILFANPNQSQRNFFGQQFGLSVFDGCIGNGIVKSQNGGSSFSLGKTGSASIPSNGQQPRLKRSGWVPSMKIVDDTDEGFLSRIFGVFSLAKHAVAKAKNLTTKTVDQLSDRGLIPVDTSVHQNRKVF
jgi:hypothetical protein